VFAPANRSSLDQWVTVAQLPFDPDRYLETVAISVRDVLRYAVVNLNDAASTLGGFPFDNHSQWYRGSANDLRLNVFVPRRTADPEAVVEMRAYNTSGQLTRPLITLHTLRDQQVPYFHEILYTLKTLSSGSFLVDHVNITVDRFEHCNFTPGEAIGAFALMLLYAGDLDVLLGVGSVLQGEALVTFEHLAQQYQIPYQLGGQRLRAQRRQR
jgi:hypothetical protein